MGIHPFVQAQDNCVDVQSVDINPGGDDSFPFGFTAVGDKVFFSATDPTLGSELRIASCFSEDEAGFIYPSEVCFGDANPTATITGITGGSFSVDNGATIDAVTGELDLSSTTTGTTYTITYTSNNTGTCGPFDQMITVHGQPEITGMSSLCAGATITLMGTGTPATMTPWTSGTTAVATVDDGGVVTGISEGSSLITYTDSNGCMDTMTVTVLALPEITGMSSLCAGATITLMGTGTPATMTPWTSDTPAIATVDDAGVVTGVSAGSSLITYRDSNGCMDTMTVTVLALPEITGMSSLCAGATITLMGTSTPATMTPWISGTPSVATVDDGGVVTGVSAGSSLITYTDSNGCMDTIGVTIFDCLDGMDVLSITDPCNCSNPNNIELPDGRFLFNDTLRVVSSTSPVTLSSTDGFLLDDQGNAIPINTVFTLNTTTGMYELVVYTLADQSSSIMISNGVSAVPFVVGPCAACVIIPTIGEWGVMCLSLLLMIMGVVVMRQREFTY